MKAKLQWSIVVVASAASVVFAVPVADPSPIPAALDRYASGHFDVVSSLLANKNQPRQELARQLEHDGPTWIDAMDSLAAPKRRLIAAAFALDLADELPNAEWIRGQRLLAWGCARLRDDPHPQPGERLWYLASIGVAQRGTWSALLGRSWPRPPQPAQAAENAVPDYVQAQPDSLDESTAELVEGHLAHAIARFADAPEFQLAKVRAIIQGSWGAGRSGVPLDEQGRAGMFPGDITSDYIARLAARLQGTDSRAPDLRTQLAPGGLVVSGSGNRFELSIGPSITATDEALEIKELRGALTILEQLAGPGPLLADVHLYYGLIGLRFADPAHALEHFAAVEHLTTDPDQLYNVRVLEGIGHERLREWDAAVAAYRSALDAMPRARTASTLLTSVLIRRGRGAEAAPFADAFLSAPSGPDPWTAFLHLDSRIVADYFDQLRKAIQ